MCSLFFPIRAGRWWGGVFLDADGSPCIDESCVVGANACAERNPSGWLVLVLSGIITLLLLGIMVYACYVVLRTCATRTCSKNITNSTLVFATLSAIVQVAWAASDLVQVHVYMRERESSTRARRDEKAVVNHVRTLHLAYVLE